MSFAYEIKDRLVAQGVGVYGTNIFISSKSIIPPTGGPYLTIIETGGSGPTRIQNKTTPATRRPTAQIVTRATATSDARTMSEAALAALDGNFNVTLSGVFYERVTARQEPTDIGLDDVGRQMFSFNIDAERQP